MGTGPATRIQLAERNVARVRAVMALANANGGEFDAAIDELAPEGPIRISDGDGLKLAKHFQRWSQDARAASLDRLRNLQRLVAFGSLALAGDILVETVADLDLRLDHDSDEWSQIRVFAETLCSKPAFVEYQRKERARLAKVAAEAEAKRLRLLRAPLVTLLRQLQGADRQIHFGCPDLEEHDEALCRAWSNDSSRQPFELGSLGELIGGYHAMRLYSARLAEKVAAKYYTQLGHSVADVSLHQVTGESDRWKTHDLEVDGIAVDVKHARRSFSSPESYSEHSVANWKLKTRLGSAVKIAGVLSNYVGFDQFFDGGSHPVFVFLGEISLPQLEADATWFEDRTKGRLKFVELSLPKYFPGWFFDYGPEHYGDVDLPIESISERIEAAVESGLPLREVPGHLLVFARPEFSVERFGSARLRNELQQMRASVGFSRTTAVLFLLSELVLAACEEIEGFDHHALKQLMLFEDGEGDQIPPRPLGRLDSESFVANMLEALTIAWTRAREELRTFTRFQLARANILRGDPGDGTWTTVIAYCGGFTAGPRIVRCGRAPLVIGEDTVCTLCRHLICSQCGWCSQDCPQNASNPLRLNADKQKGRSISEFD